MRRIALVVLAVAGLMLSCSVMGSAPAAPAAPGVLFQDDFSDPGSGWDRVEGDTATTDYFDDAYRIFVNESDADFWANPGLRFTDVSVGVEATKVGGSDDNDLGVICRYQDTENFYYGAISSDGYVGILKIQDGTPSVLSGEGLEPDDAVLQGDATNLIRFDCVGRSLMLFVNGTQVASAEDADWTEGDVGLVAGTFDTPGTDVYFDNFIVREP